MRKLVAALCALSLAIQAAQPLSAHADTLPFLDPPKAGALACLPEEPGPRSLPQFETDVEEYIAAFYSGSPLATARASKRISAAVYRNPGSAEYVERLRYIDAQTSRAPDAIYDLAKRLQIRWEHYFLPKLRQLGITPEQRLEAAETSTEVGLIVGMAALGALMIATRQATPFYFRSLGQVLKSAGVRAMLPWGGLTAGYLAGQGLNAARLSNAQIPVSPAHVMHLDLPNSGDDLDEASLYRDLMAKVSGAAGGSIAYALLDYLALVRAIQVGATPAKINPAVLIGSWAIGLAIEEGVRAGADLSIFGDFREQIVNGTRLAENSVVAGDDLELLQSADRMVRASLQLSSYLSQPIREAEQEYAEGKRAVEAQYGPGTEAYSAEVSKLTRGLAEKVSQAMKKMDYRADEDYRASLVIQALKGDDSGERSTAEADPLAALESFDTGSKARGQAYWRAFETWLSHSQESHGVSYTPVGRARIFRQEYMKGIAAARDRQLANELRTGRISRHPTHVLLQAASFLRSLNREEVIPQADELMALIERSEWAADLARAYQKDSGESDEPYMNPL